MSFWSRPKRSPQRQRCTSCGGMKPYESFTTATSTWNKLSLICHDCLALDKAVAERDADELRNGPPLMSFEEIGRRFGISRETARQDEAKAMRKIRREVMRQTRDGDEFWLLVAEECGMPAGDLAEAEK